MIPQPLMSASRLFYSTPRGSDWGWRGGVMSKPETERSHGQMRHFQRASRSWWQVQTTQACSLRACQAPEGPEAEASALEDPLLASSPTLSGAPGPQGLREGRSSLSRPHGTSQGCFSRSGNAQRPIAAGRFRHCQDESTHFLTPHPVAAEPAPAPAGSRDAAMPSLQQCASCSKNPRELLVIT